MEYAIISKNFEGPHVTPKGDLHWLLTLELSGKMGIVFSSGVAAHSVGTQLEPGDALSWRPMTRDLGGDYVKARIGWFARQCEKAKCSWFVPMVERMAAGEEVRLEEIEMAYREHNGGKEMPKGTWAELKRAGEV